MRRQRLVLYVVAAAMVVGGVAAALVHVLGGGIGTGPSRPMSFQILYHDVENVGTGATVRYERLTVQRPFSSSDLRYPSPPGARSVPQSGTYFSATELFSVDSRGVHPVSGREPGPGGDDQDLVTQLPDLEARGLARPLSTTLTLAGRTCQEYRLSEPPAGALTPLSGSDHDDLCITSDGLELAEDWTYHGHLVLHRRAVQVTEGPVRSPVTPAPDDRSPQGSGAASAFVTNGAKTFLPRPPVPAGFRRAEEVGFIEPDPQNAQAILASSVTWSFTSGPDVITVEAGTSPPGDLPWATETTRTTSIRLAGLGSATTALRSDGCEIRVDLGNGSWVRIRGTVPLANLVSYAETVPAPAAP